MQVETGETPVLHMAETAMLRFTLRLSLSLLLPTAPSTLPPMTEAPSIAYFDCFAGAGGDMIVASLLHAGAGADALRNALAGLKLAATFSAKPVNRGGIGGLQFEVQAEHEHHHRGLGDILAMIGSAGLPPRVADRAKRIFTRLGEAEAKIHGLPVEKVHFHEVGAADSIMDIVGACVAMELLGIERVLCSPIPTGRGMVTMAHGTFPVPAPATAELLRGVPLAAGDIEGEMTTPTAAAILTTLAESFGPLPAMKVASIGYGAGSRFQENYPNLLRVFVGRADNSGDSDSVIELSANIDDCTGEILGATMSAFSRPVASTPGPRRRS